MMDSLVDDQARAWTFDELLREGISLIPAYAPEWTNHNPSDPGITLVELFAYFSEILAYRALRITPDAKLHFLRLLEGGETLESKALRGAPATDIEKAIRARVQALSQAQCAVTPRDFEQLAVDAAAHLGERAVVRALCVPGTDLRHSLGERNPAATVDAPADMSVVLAPERELAGDGLDRLCAQVQEALAPRCLLTTRVHVVGPVVLNVFIGCRIALQPGTSLVDAMEQIDQALRRRFGPLLPDEPPADARPFGRPLYLAEIAEAIDRCEDIDYVDSIDILRMNTHGSAHDDDDSRVGIRIGMMARPGKDAWLGGRVSIGIHRILRDETGEVESVKLYPWELVRVRLASEAVHEITGGNRHGH